MATKAGISAFDRLIDMENEVEMARAKLLEAAGWEHGSDYPGGFWLWSKEINGKVIATSKANALDIEEVLQNFGP